MTELNIDELLTDEDDIMEISALLFSESHISGKNWKNLKSDLNALDRNELFSALLDIASPFGVMAEDVSNFYSTYEIKSNANNAIINRSCLFMLDDLDLSWSTNKSISTEEVILESCDSIVTAIQSLLDRLNPEDFVFIDKSQLAKRLQLIEGPTPKKVSQLVPSFERPKEYFTDGDYRIIKSTYQMIIETISTLQKKSAPHQISTAFEEIGLRCLALLERMDSGEMISGIDANRSIATLSDEITIFNSQVSEILRKKDDLTKTEKGLGLNRPEFVGGGLI